MGLHPKAIMAVMLLVLDLLSRSYRVVLSTHSPLVVDVVWALKMLQAEGADGRSVLELFDVSDATRATVIMAERALKKAYRVHSLDLGANNSVTSMDISSLDPGSDDPVIAGWGGLTRFSGRIGEVVGAAVRAADGSR
jgi:hypothetical protein